MNAPRLILKREDWPNQDRAAWNALFWLPVLATISGQPDATISACLRAWQRERRVSGDRGRQRSTYVGWRQAGLMVFGSYICKCYMENDLNIAVA